MVRIHLYPEGTRVRIGRGVFPVDPTLVGQDGIVVRHERRVPGRYRVQLDGEDQFRAFDESELQPLGDERPRAADSAGDPGIHGGGAAAS